MFPVNTFSQYLLIETIAFTYNYFIILWQELGNLEILAKLKNSFTMQTNCAKYNKKHYKLAFYKMIDKYIAN